MGYMGEVKKIKLLCLAIYGALLPSLAGAQNASSPVAHIDNPPALLDPQRRVSPTDLEEVSLPARTGASTASSQQVQKKGILRKAFAHTANFIGFPLGHHRNVDPTVNGDLSKEIDRAGRLQPEHVDVTKSAAKIP